MQDERQPEARALGCTPNNVLDRQWRRAARNKGLDPDHLYADLALLGTMADGGSELLQQHGVNPDGIVAVAVVAYRQVHASDVGKQLRHATRATPVPVHRRTMVSLSDALDRMPGPPMTIGALRKASTREGFPRARSRWQRAKLYDLDELVRWKSARGASHDLG